MNGTPTLKLFPDPEHGVNRTLVPLTIVRVRIHFGRTGGVPVTCELQSCRSLKKNLAIQEISSW